MDVKNNVDELFKKYVENSKILDEGGLNKFKSVLDQNTAIKLHSFLILLSNVLDKYQNMGGVGLNKSLIERIIIFSMVWSFGALLEAEDRE